MSMQSWNTTSVLLLWIFYFLFVLCLLCLRVRLFYVSCGHLRRKGWPLGSRFCRLTVSLSLSHWYPGSSVVLDCIDSWYVHPYLLCSRKDVKTCLYTHTICFIWFLFSSAPSFKWLLVYGSYLTQINKYTDKFHIPYYFGKFLGMQY